jgi:hypothetical protein
MRTTMKKIAKFLLPTLLVAGLAVAAQPNRFIDIVVSGGATMGTATVGTVTATTGAISNQSVSGSQAIGTTSAAAASAALDVVSTTKGVLPPRMTTTQRDAVSSPAAGLFVYNTTSNKFNNYNGSAWVELGSGSSGVNYITGGDAESGTTGWATYKDAAQATPENCTAGSPTLTWTQSTSSPLRGAANFLATKDAANRQGEGASYAFTIDRQDQAKAMTISLEWEVGSGTFAVGDSSSDSDLEVYIYDVTNSQLIQPAGYKLVGGTTGQWSYQGTFQTASNSQSYRLCLHEAKSGTSAYTLKVDSVSVSPVSRLYGAPITDWTSFTMTAEGSVSNPTKGTVAVDEARWRRVGDSMEILWNYRQTAAGTAGSGTYKFLIPGGYSIDSAKITPSSGTAPPVVGAATAYDGTSDFTGYVHAYDSTHLGMVLGDESADPSTVGSASTGFDKTTLNYSFSARFPVTGWASTVAMSPDHDARIVSAKYEVSASSANTSFADNSVEIIDFDTKLWDTHGMCTTGASFKCTAPLPGKYVIDAQINWTNTTTLNFSEMLIYKNGSPAGRMARPGGTEVFFQGHAELDLSAGDYFDVRGYQDDSGGGARTIATSTGLVVLQVKRISGPATIGASENIRCRLNQAQPTGTIASTYAGAAAVVHNATTFDSHGACSTSTGKFTAPSPGVYLACASQIVSGSLTAGSTFLAIALGKNGTEYSDSPVVYSTVTASANLSASYCDTVSLLTGDTLEIRDVSNAGTPTHTSDALKNYFTVTRLGL